MNNSLIDQIEAVLRDEDPIRLIAGGAPADEYRGEAERIAGRIRGASTADELRRIVHREFVESFDAELAGEEAKYQGIAERIFKLIKD